MTTDWCATGADLPFARRRCLRHGALVQPMQQRLACVSTFLLARALMPQGMPAQRIGILHAVPTGSDLASGEATW